MTFFQQKNTSNKPRKSSLGKKIHSFFQQNSSLNPQKNLVNSKRTITEVNKLKSFGHMFFKPPVKQSSSGQLHDSLAKKSFSMNPNPLRRMSSSTINKTFGTNNLSLKKNNKSNRRRATLGSRRQNTLQSGVSKSSEFFIALVENRARQIGVAAFSLFTGVISVAHVNLIFSTFAYIFDPFVV